MLAASAAALPALLATAGCRSSDAFAGPDPLAGRPALSPDVITLQAVIAAERDMIALYQAAVKGIPASRARALEGLLAQHRQHLARLQARLVLPAPSATPSPSPSRSPAPARVSIARLRFLVRQSFDHSPYLAKTLEESVAVFRPLLRRKLPHLDQRTLTRRWLLAAELAQQTLANTLTLHLACPPATGPKEAELEQFIKDLVAFIAAGLRAPQ